MLEKDGGIKKENSSQEPQQLGGLLKKAEGILNLQGDIAFMNGLDVKSEGKAIIVKNGIFTISQDLETSSVKQDPALKALVDSILR
ncbi:MAG TPA: hypothetical protein DCP61_00510 [Treponema sp.]|jgi:hypothetical protein|nr:hypothetical protein [Treponema sp.]HBB13110.1 hypothetical protein [Treponema sp.]